MEYEVLVQLKGEVLDPEGRAIQEALKTHGINSVQSVVVSKRYLISLAEDAIDPEKLIHKIASAYLSNPVSQSFSVARTNL